MHPPPPCTITQVSITEEKAFAHLPKPIWSLPHIIWRKLHISGRMECGQMGQISNFSATIGQVMFGGKMAQYVTLDRQQVWEVKASWYEAVCVHGTGWIQIIKEKMIGVICQESLENNLLPSTRTMNMRWGWTFQQNKNPQHIRKKTLNGFQRKKTKVLEWPSQLTDLNPIEHLWKELKIKIQQRES